MPTRWIRVGSLVFVLFSLLLAFPAEAQEPRYTFVEGGLLHDNPEGGDSDDGLFVGGSFGTKRFHIFAEYDDPGSVELWQVGGGWHGLLGQRADIIAEAAYIDADFDEGYRVTAGVRWYVMDKLELDGYVTRTDIDEFENTTLGVGAAWDLTARFSVGARVDFGDEGDSFRAFARFYLGKS
jgi:hypothetical protein